MDFKEKEAKKVSLIVGIIILFILAFLVIRPFIFPIIAGLFLAYAFFPVYRRLASITKSKNLAASLVTILILLIIFLFLWFITPLLIKEFFDVFLSLQRMDFKEIITITFPTASEQLVEQISVTLNSALSSLFANITSYLSTFIAEIPKMIIDFFVIGFIFFYVLRDYDKLASFVKSISPINELKRRVIVKNFKEMTNSIVYGWVVVGLVQGLIAGLGFLIFGIDNALVLTVLATLFSIIPFLGPFIVYVPVAIYLFAKGQMVIAAIFLLYNVIMVSTMDNFLRSFIIARKTNIHSTVILIGMVGGFFAFGAIGLLIGPIILAYVLILIESFRDKSIYAIFS